MSQKKLLDLAGLTAYDKKLKDYFKYEIVDIVEDAIKELFPIPDNNYVTFTAEEDNSSIGLAQLSTNQTLEYSTDTNIWTAFDTETNISLNNGDNVYVRGMLNGDTNSNYTQFKMTGKISASGNCNAIWNYQDLNAPLKAYCGRSMFSGCTSLTKAPELPAKTLADYCYSSMFNRCTSLTTAPELPATKLADKCYANMFSGCSSLTTAPELPATILHNYCYQGMFQNCTSLTTTPELSTSTLAVYCYSKMFYGCKLLVTVPNILPATTLANGCYDSMFYNCTSLTTSPELPATTLADKCYSYMFYNCTSLTTSPELPATKLERSCYFQMFYGCIKLNHITCLATNISATGCTSTWVYRIASTGTFVKHPSMKKWTTGIDGIPNRWKVKNAEL